MKRIMTAGELKQHIKHVPDHLPVYFQTPQGREVVNVVELNETDQIMVLHSHEDPNLVDLLLSGRKLEAIKAYRATNPCSLIEAKTHIENLMAKMN